MEEDRRLMARFWASGDEIAQAKQDLESVKKAAQSEITRALEVERMCDEKIVELDYLDRVAARFGPEDVLISDFTSSSGLLVGGTISVLAQETQSLAKEYLASSERQRSAYGLFKQRIDYVGDLSASAVYAVVKIEQYMEEKAPDYVPLSHQLGPDEGRSLENISSRLRTLLEPFGPNLLQALGGVESDLQRGDSESLSHAANAATDVLDQVINQLAPKRAVQKQSWFSNEPERRGSEKEQQVKYILYGSGANVDAEEKEGLDRLAESIPPFRSLLEKFKHVHDPDLDRKQVERTVSVVLSAVCNILTIHNARVRAKAVQ